MIVWRIRWKILFEPWCWLRGHRIDRTYPMSVWHPVVWWCRRCEKSRPTSRQERDYDEHGLRTVWSVQLDWNGNETGRSWMGGRVGDSEVVR